MTTDYQNQTKRLQKSIILASAIGIFTVGVIVALAGMIPLYEYLKEEEKRNIVLALNAKTVAVEEYLARVKDVAMQISSRTKAREALDAYNMGIINSSDLEPFLKRIMLDAMNYTQDLWGITRLDSKGLPVVEVGIELPREYLIPAKEDESIPKIQGLVTFGTTPLLVVRSPIIDRQPRIIGTDILVLRLTNLRRIIEDYTGLGQTGEAFLGYAETDNVGLLFPMRRHHGPASMSLSEDPAVFTALLASAGDRKSGVFVTESSVNGKEVVAYGPIRGSNWGIGLKISLDELFDPVRRQIYATSTIILALIAVGTLGMVLLVRPLAGKTIIHTDQLAREIREKTSNLRQELRERKRMERWLRDSERRYQMLLANIPDVIFILDDKGCFSYANVQVEKFLACKVRDILDTPLEDYVVAEDKPRIRKILETDVASIWDEEVGIIDINGELKHSRIRCNASIEEETGNKRYEGVMRDITLRKRLEQELKSSREELLEKIRIIDDLYEHIVQSGMSKCISDHTAEVAHELRQPLAIIGGVARRLERRIRSGNVDASQELPESCNIMIHEVERLEKILTGLIDFTTHSTLHLEKADPNGIIETVLEKAASRVEEKNLHLEKKLGGEVGDMLLDPTLFEQVVRYLVSNAIDASPPGEVLRVETGVSIPSERAQEAGGLASETYFEMKISNYGTSMPKDDLQKIFSPFYVTSSYGAGIGLTVSKRIIEDHNGSISVKCDEEGTVFTVWLPFIHRGGSDLMVVS
jgi:PAS domain S-box-containing protein